MHQDNVLDSGLRQRRNGPMRPEKASLGRVIVSRGILAMPPTFGNGKICYLEIPATDVMASAAFYQRVFGWAVRRRDDGSTAFDDSVGEVSGTWVLGRPPSTSPGILISIMVNDVAATMAQVVAEGGKLVQPIGADAPEITARFADPAGNVWCLYQHRSH